MPFFFEMYSADPYLQVTCFGPQFPPVPFCILGENYFRARAFGGTYLLHSVRQDWLVQETCEYAQS